MHEVYAYGMVGSSTLCVLENAFPPRAGYAEVVDIFESFGGEAVGSAHVLARLGVATKLDGNWLRDDDDSRWILRVLSDAGIDCTRLTLSDAAVAVREIVVADGDARTVFGSYGRLLGSHAWNEPSRHDIQTSRIVCLDPFFGDQSVQAARMCVDVGVPFVSIDVAPGTEIARHASVVVVSEEYLRGTLDRVNPEMVLTEYLVESTGLVVVTQGAGPVFFGRDGGRTETIDPFEVDVRDTTGAGDAMRAGIIYGMLKGMDTAATIRVGCAVAGIVCERQPGVMHSPTRDELDRFLESV